MRRFGVWLRRLAIAALAAGALGVGGLAVAWRLAPFPTEVLATRARSARVTDRDGRLLLESIGADDQWRCPVELAGISPWLIQATCAVEDERFFLHPGVDPLAALRASAQNLARGRVHSGASTLTMQVCRMLDPRPRTFEAKAVQAFRALQIERVLSKEEILETYLNLAPYGRNYRGAEVASRRWFGKSAADLCLAEAALLAGLPQSPHRYRPDRFPERALARRNHVLDRMLAEGMIHGVEHARASAEPLVLRREDSGGGAWHAARMALARRAEGGQTTLDAVLQSEVEALAWNHARSLPEDAQVAVVVIDAQLGDVLAVMGSLDPGDPREGQVNGATSRRSPGSALKPFLYAAAFAGGQLDPDGWLPDEERRFGDWEPRNFDRDSAGRVPVDEALRRSLNLPALEVVRRVGVERCLGVLESCGLPLPDHGGERAGLALATGGLEVRLFDLVEAYGVLAREGTWIPARFYPETSQAPRRVLGAEVCREINRILSYRERMDSAVEGLPVEVSADMEAEDPADADPRGKSIESLPGPAESEPDSPLSADPATPPSPAAFASSPDPGLGDPWMWKTGTSSGNRDAWAVGHDGRHAVGVWVGRFSGSGDPAFVGSRAAEPLLLELLAHPRLRR